MICRRYYYKLNTIADTLPIFSELTNSPVHDMITKILNIIMQYLMQPRLANIWRY